MTLAQILAPVAAATIVNVVPLGLAWRADQTEKRTGSSPWYLGAIIIGYALATLGFFYLDKGHHISGSLGIFGAAAIGEVLGASAIFGLFHAIYRRDRQPTGQRVFEIGASVFMVGAIMLGLFFA